MKQALHKQIKLILFLCITHDTVISIHEYTQTIWCIFCSPSQKKVKKILPLPGFEPGSPRPRSKSDDLDCSAMGPTSIKLILI